MQKEKLSPIGGREDVILLRRPTPLHGGISVTAP
jgi:hypothetical protein